MLSNEHFHPSERIDLCLVSPQFYPLLVGPGERFRRYAPGLRRRGIDLRAFSIQFENLSPFEVVDGIPIQRVQSQKKSRQEQDFAFMYRLLREMLDREHRPDVLQFFGRSIWVGLAVRCLRALGIPCLMVFTLLGENHGPAFRRRLRNFNRRWIFESFDCIVTSSGVMTQELREIGVSKVPIETIPNGVDLERFRPASTPDERGELRQRLGMEHDDLVVVFVGSIFPRKGVDTLVAAWHAVAGQYPRARLILVGSRHEDQAKHQPFRDRVDHLVATSPAPERVTFTGAVQNVEEYLRAADLFVFPSEREGMPNVVPEAMATGLPCILTPFHGLPEEFGEPGREYRLVPRQAEALSEAILDLLGNQEAREMLGKRARVWAQQQMDVEKSLDRFAALYRELASKYRVPRERQAERILGRRLR